jgi:ketosteroid isomerase-like protein
MELRWAAKLAVLGHCWVRARGEVEAERPRYSLRATQVYRREGGEWKVAHRHADTVTE